MPVPIIAAGVVAMAVPLVIKILVALGVSVVTYVGADFAITEAQSFIDAQIGSMPASMLQIMYLAGFDTGIKIIFACWSAYISIRVTMGAFSKVKISPT